MNKQEAIEIIEQSKIKIANRGRVIFKAGEIIVENVQVDYVPLEVVVNTIDQIHEPQKVVVPKFVAEWIEAVKSVDWSLKYALTNTSDEVHVWIVDKDNQETFARAWLDGYEVEQEQLYTVEIPDPNSRYTYRFLSKNDRGVFIDGSCDDCWKDYDSNHLTEAEIKQDFEWAWDAGFAKEVE
ncbi:TPA: DUF1642 domain-containing protein [Streptococcus suis]